MKTGLIPLFLFLTAFTSHAGDNCLEGNCENGKGKFIYPDTRVYDGEWQDGKKHGQGVMIFHDGTVYEGQWQDDSMNGRGCVTWPDGRHHEGLWVDRKAHGRGVMELPDGSRHAGLWTNGKFQAAKPNPTAEKTVRTHQVSSAPADHVRQPVQTPVQTDIINSPEVTSVPTFC